MHVTISRKTLFCSSWLQFDFSWVHVLLNVICLFIYVYWCPIWFPYQKICRLKVKRLSKGEHELLIIPGHPSSTPVLSGIHVAHVAQPSLFCVVFYRSLFAPLSFVFLAIVLSLSPSRSWPYGSWIYIYMSNQCLSPIKLWIRIPLMARLLDATLYNKVCQTLVRRLFSLVSSINKTDCHNIAEILLKLGLNNNLWFTVSDISNVFLSYYLKSYKCRCLALFIILQYW